MNFIGDDLQLMLLAERGDLFQLRLRIDAAGRILRIAQNENFRLFVNFLLHVLKVQRITAILFMHRTQRRHAAVGQRLVDKWLISRGRNQNLIAFLAEQPDCGGH